MATVPTNASSNSCSKKVYAQNPSRIPRPTPPPANHSDTVAPEDSSSSHSGLPYNGSGSSIPGYVKFDNDNKVRISLNCGSKSAIRELKRKLVIELDQVRSLRKKLEAKETNQFKGCNATATLARVNSEVSYVGPTNSRHMQELLADNNVSNTSSRHKNFDRDKQTPKVTNKKEKMLISENSGKKLKPSNGTKKKGGVGDVMGWCNGKVPKKCGDLLEKLMKHKFGWVFNKPVDVKKLKLHDYFTIIKHPMDLGTVMSRLKKNWYKASKEFAEDVRLTFNNAMKYNEKGQDVHIMADVLLKLFEENWAEIEAEFSYVERFDKRYDASLPIPAPKRVPASTPPTSAPTSAPPRKMPSESRISSRSESMANPMDSSLNVANIPTLEDRTPASKNHKEIDPQGRAMTFEEKQRLSADLLNLPSDKLYSVFEIMKKRNPGLSQEGDEIEVDIDSFDSETLWELHRLVTNHKNKRIAEPVVQARGEAGHNIQDTNLTSSMTEAQEPKAVEKFIVSSPRQGERQGDNVSRSSSSSSSSSDSGSSSSDSDSDSSS